MKLKLQIAFLMSTGGTIMATTWFNGEYYVENGETFEDAEKRLIEMVKKKKNTIIPQPKEIEIDL